MIDYAPCWLTTGLVNLCGRIVLHAQKSVGFFPRPMVEQIIMGTIGEQFDPLRRVGCPVDPQSHLYRDHRIALAVQDENRGPDRADVRDSRPCGL